MAKLHFFILDRTVTVILIFYVLEKLPQTDFKVQNVSRKTCMMCKSATSSVRVNSGTPLFYRDGFSPYSKSVRSMVKSAPSSVRVNSGTIHIRSSKCIFNHAILQTFSITP
ncbi:MAG: hypothetical protein A3H98_11035 [Bacteroidetes bacterium RIFCSPLOWO2_02_FULL_36_8]|nr:MAG: hypothetical protein A3H98_11035 [Bacteroidetes bacterium RIFCSPLOWO2_02_FULL_36_8]OFY70606.1 MAG: hypothetical protein A3G23_07695 [Bacteroidetes bacterium RIFCSPLOWO2_12_FULL_37_12]